MTGNTNFLDQKHSMPIEETSSDKGGRGNTVHALNGTVKCVKQHLSPPSPIKEKNHVQLGKKLTW